MSIWLFELHQPEETFWRRQNPHRLHALFNAYYKPKKAPKKAKTGLMEYLSTGG